MNEIELETIELWKQNSRKWETRCKAHRDESVVWASALWGALAMLEDRDDYSVPDAIKILRHHIAKAETTLQKYQANQDRGRDHESF